MGGERQREKGSKIEERRDRERERREKEREKEREKKKRSKRCQRWKRKGDR